MIRVESDKLHDFIGQVSLRKKSPINKGPMWKVTEIRKKAKYEQEIRVSNE